MVIGMFDCRTPPGRDATRTRYSTLTSRRGQLLGSFVGPRGTQPLRELVLNPDGSFSGETTGGAAAGGDPKHVISFAGKFSGSTVSLTGCGKSRDFGKPVMKRARTG